MEARSPIFNTHHHCRGSICNGGWEFPPLEDLGFPGIRVKHGSTYLKMVLEENPRCFWFACGFQLRIKTHKSMILKWATSWNEGNHPCSYPLAFILSHPALALVFAFQESSVLQLWVLPIVVRVLHLARMLKQVAHLITTWHRQQWRHAFWGYCSELNTIRKFF